jgi:hypothetical protein
MDERATAFCSSRRRGQAALGGMHLRRPRQRGAPRQAVAYKGPDPDPASLIINGPSRELGQRSRCACLPSPLTYIPSTHNYPFALVANGQVQSSI